MAKPRGTRAFGNYANTEVRMGNVVDRSSELVCTLLQHMELGPQPSPTDAREDFLPFRGFCLRQACSRRFFSLLRSGPHSHRQYHFFRELALFGADLSCPPWRRQSGVLICVPDLQIESRPGPLQTVSKVNHPHPYRKCSIIHQPHPFVGI